MTSLNVTEWMSGSVAEGAVDCAAGAARGVERQTTFAHEVLIKIADIEEFRTSPRHEAKMGGHVECAHLGPGRHEIKDGTFNMLVESANPTTKYMLYRMPLEVDGVACTVLGFKTLRDDPGPDLWRDITTLEVAIYRSNVNWGTIEELKASASPRWPDKPISMGIIRISLLDGMRSALSFESPGATRSEAIRAKKKFIKFYGSRLWDIFLGGPVEPQAAVKWLLASDLLRNASKIARSQFASELDLRDWMGNNPVVDRWANEEELWFDYVADTGDDPAVMASIAQAVSTPHRIEDLEANEKWKVPANTTLDVGPFLFLGGDTAYHVADESTLRSRFVEPFRNGLRALDKPPERFLYSIPGNHDYYDNLVGFNRMFRKPLSERGVLEIPGLTLEQEATYIKVLLPGDWQLWGVDLAGGFDFRQASYFGAKVPEKLILAVPTPAVTFDHVRVSDDPDNEEHRGYRTLFRVGEDDELPSLAPPEVTKALPKGSCRVHLGGDDHHYIRYGGAVAPESATHTAIVSGGGGAFLHPTETSLGGIDRTTTYPSVEDSRRETSRLAELGTIWDAGLVWLVGGILSAVLYLTLPRPSSALTQPVVYCGALAVGAVALRGAQWVSVRAARGRKRIARASRPHARPLTQVEYDQLSRDQFWVRRGVRAACWFVAAAIALTAPFVATHFVPFNPLARESVFFVLCGVVATLLTLVAAGAAGGPKGMRGIGFAVLGLLHAGVHLGLPLLLMVRASVIELAVVVAVALVFMTTAPWLYKKGHRGALLVLWLLQGPAMVAALLWAPYEGLHNFIAIPHHWMWTCIAFLVGALISSLEFGWYLLVAAAFNGHNNEAGAAVRTTKYKQWIRFHVTKDRLTGYVLALPDPKKSAKPELVDVFHIAP